MGKVQSFVDLSSFLECYLLAYFVLLHTKLNELSSLLRNERLQPHMPIVLVYSELFLRHRRDHTTLVSIEINVLQEARAWYFAVKYAARTFQFPCNRICLKYHSC